MRDREFLMWLHSRLTEVHKESPIVDYMHKLRAIIKETPEEKETPNVALSNSLHDLVCELNNSKQNFKEPDGGFTWQTIGCY